MAHNQMSGTEGSGTVRSDSRKSKNIIKWFPFDLTLAETTFKKVTASDDEDIFTRALLQRNEDLTPSKDEQVAVANLVRKVQTVLNNLIVSLENSDSFQLGDVRPVGPFQNGTMLKGQNVADIVIVLKTLPTKQAVQALGIKLEKDLNILMKNEGFLTYSINEMGIEIANDFATVRVMVTTFQNNINKLDPEIHMDRKIVVSNLNEYHRSRWFEKNVRRYSIKVLIRLLCDIRSRFHGLKSLNQWMLNLLANFCVTNNQGHSALPINEAFRRAFRLLAAGIFLPGSAGIQDPCKRNKSSVHVTMSLEEQDTCCLTAQTLLRVLCHGGYKEVLGVGLNQLNVEEMSYWNGVIVYPLANAHKNNLEEEDVCMEVEAVNDMKSEAVEGMETTAI